MELLSSCTFLSVEDTHMQLSDVHEQDRRCICMWLEHDLGW